MFSSEHCLGLVASLANMIDSAVTDCADQKVESGLNSDAAEVCRDFRIHECWALTECYGKRCVVIAPKWCEPSPILFLFPGSVSRLAPAPTPSLRGVAIIIEVRGTDCSAVGPLLLSYLSFSHI